MLPETDSGTLRPGPNTNPELTLSKYQHICTPAFVYDEGILSASIDRVRAITDRAGCELLYSLKPFAAGEALKLFVRRVAGFAASSVFEARVAREVLQDTGSVHLTTPGLQDRDLVEVRELCDYVSFNSLSHFRRFSETLGEGTETGIRVNPQQSYVSDSRYDPCRKGSKLGVPLDRLCHELETNPGLFGQLTGLHFHTNCDSTNFRQLREIVERIVRRIGPGVFNKLRWLNMGGGYHFPADHDYTDFFSVVDLVKRAGLEVFIEPGSALVRDAGSVVSTVVDLFRVDGQCVAVLDTTVNHMPEVFEYQFEPDVLGDVEDGHFEYTLAGSSCLAGDVFGVYAFLQPLELGSRIVFQNMGAYSLVKSHMFNGINRPSIYAATRTGEVVLKKAFGYTDFTSQLGLSVT